MMGLKDIKLWKENSPDADLVSSIVDLHNEGLPTLTPYLIKEEKLHPAIIVCPGGGFKYRAPCEGEPIAKWLNQIGINAFVLNYRVALILHLLPLRTQYARLGIFVVMPWN